MAVLATPFFLQFVDANGAPVRDGKVYTYSAGTNTPKATFTDFTENFQAPNPVPLDSAGRATIWINGAYKFVLTDENDVVLETTDNVVSFSTPAGAANPFSQTFSGDGSNVNFTLSEPQGNNQLNIIVYVDNNDGKGYNVLLPSQYALNGTALVLGTPPAVGTNNIYVFAPSSILGSAAASASAAAASEANAAASAVISTTQAGIATSAATEAQSWAIGDNIQRPEGSAKAWAQVASAITIPVGSVALNKLVNATAQYKIMVRVSAGAGAWEEMSSSAAVFNLLAATNQAGIRTAAGLGSAATQNTGTSGANVPLLNGANTWSGAQTLPGGATATPAVAFTGSSMGIYADSAAFHVGTTSFDAFNVNSSGQAGFGRGAAQASASTGAGVQFGRGTLGRIETYIDGTGSTDQVIFYNNAAVTVQTAGRITSSGAAVAYNTSSDYRLKEDEREIENAIDKLLALRPLDYRWKINGERAFGFFAHEVQAVYPTAVYGEKDAVDEDGNPVHQCMDYSRLVPLLTAALQEEIKLRELRDEQIESLIARIEALEAAQ